VDVKKQEKIKKWQKKGHAGKSMAFLVFFRTIIQQ